MSLWTYQQLTGDLPVNVSIEIDNLADLPTLTSSVRDPLPNPIDFGALQGFNISFSALANFSGTLADFASACYPNVFGQQSCFYPYFLINPQQIEFIDRFDSWSFSISLNGDNAAISIRTDAGCSSAPCLSTGVFTDPIPDLRIAVTEPSSFLMLAVGLGLLACLTWRRTSYCSGRGRAVAG